MLPVTKGLRAGALLLAALSAACSGESESAQRAIEPQEIELLTWWSQPTERAAINAVIAVNDAKHPNVHIRVLTADSQLAMDDSLTMRLADGNAPTAFQANLGGNALQWADAALSLDTRADAWKEAFQTGILERVTHEKQLIGVPLALTRQNNAYYNKRVLTDLGLEIPTGKDEFVAWLEQLADKGYTHPLCIGDTDFWVSAHALFEDIVPAYVGADYSRKFWSGKLSADDPKFSEALDFAATLNPYWNLDFPRLEWDKGLLRVMEEAADPAEQCVMAPMGDWGGPILETDYEPDKDFAQRAWPGAEELFVLAGDAFIITQGVRNELAALDFFDTLASEEGQVAFNAKKGSVPARTLKEAPPEFGELIRANMADLASGTALPGFKVLGSSTFPFNDMAKLTDDFLLSGDKKPLIDFIRAHYDQLAQ